MRKAQRLELMDGLAAPLNERANTVFLQILFEAVAALSFDLVVLIDVEVVWIGVRGRRKHDLGDVFQTLRVMPCQRAAAVHYLCKFLQLEVKESRLKIVETRIQPPLNDRTIGASAVVAQLIDPLVDRVVVGDRGPAVAQAAEDLGGIEADGGS